MGAPTAIPCDRTGVPQIMSAAGNRVNVQRKLGIAFIILVSVLVPVGFSFSCDFVQDGASCWLIQVARSKGFFDLVQNRAAC